MLDSIANREKRGIPTPIRLIATIHFARWIIWQDGDRHRLIFTSNYDGSLWQYLRDFAALIGMIWTGCRAIVTAIPMGDIRTSMRSGLTSRLTRCRPPACVVHLNDIQTHLIRGAKPAAARYYFLGIQDVTAFLGFMQQPLLQSLLLSEQDIRALKKGFRPTGKVIMAVSRST